MTTKKKMIERMRTKFSRVAGVIMVGFFAFCGSRWEGSTAGAEELCTYLGLIFVSIGACGRLWCMVYMAGNKTQKLVTEGPYSLCRNPLYLFSFIGIIGMGLGSSTLTVPLVFVIAFCLYYPFTIKKEEDRLLLIHGEAFKRYCDKTPRYVPSLKNFNEPEQVVLDPRIFRRHVGNAILWICIYGLWEIFEYLRLEKWIPTFFNIW